MTKDERLQFRRSSFVLPSFVGLEVSRRLIMPNDIIVDTQLPAEMREMIGAECEVQIWPADAADPLFHAAVGLLTYGHPRVDGAVMDRMPNLKVISNFGVGVDHIDLAAARARGIPVGNTPHILDVATADINFDLPLTAETGGMIGRAQLRQMRPTAWLINVARGGVVDHAALVEALEQRWIAGAALDVTEPEPLPRDHPLLRMDNAIIAPHLGSATRQTRRAMARLTVDNLNAGLAGLPLPSRIA